MSAADQPLAGVRIVDLSLLLPGPWATLMLAELGAAVTHVEPPGGDVLRTAMPSAYRSVNRGKRVVELDLKSDEGRAQLSELIAEADVLVEGFRPGTASRLGFGPEDVRARHPRLIYLSLSGYGATGPYARHPGHDVNYLGVAGVLSISGAADGPPHAGGGVPVADLTASLFATQAILAALLRRERTGSGATIDVPIAAAALKLLEPRLAEYDGDGAPAKRELMARAAYGAYPCRDGRWLTVGCIEDHFWRRLCAAVGLPELLEDPRLRTYRARCRHADEVNAALSAGLLQRDRAEWLELLLAADVPAAPVHEIGELEQDPQVRHWGLVEHLEEVRGVGLPYTGLGRPAALVSPR